LDYSFVIYEQSWINRLRQRDRPIVTLQRCRCQRAIVDSLDSAAFPLISMTPALGTNGGKFRQNAEMQSSAYLKYLAKCLLTVIFQKNHRLP
jgi:hypothetical protein